MYDINFSLSLWREFIDLIHESKPDRKRSGDKRELIEIRRDGDYPVKTTIKIFKSRNNQESHSSLIQVVFKVPSRDDVRTIFVADTADDKGGLLRQWLGDFMAELRSYTIRLDVILSPLSHGQSQRQSQSQRQKGSKSKSTSTTRKSSQSSSSSSSSPPLTTATTATLFHVFISTGGVYLPNRLVINPRSSNRNNRNSNGNGNSRYELEESAVGGKVINQMLREHVPLPEAFASPLTMLFLRSGENGIENSELSINEIKQVILDFDNGYLGTLNSLINDVNRNSIDVDVDVEVDGDDDENRDMVIRKKICTFIREYIYKPRIGALKAMKAGFDIIPLCRHLEVFSWDQFKCIFIGRDVITSEDIINILEFMDENTTESTENNIEYDMENIKHFQDIFIQTVKMMTIEDSRSLVRFCTGAPYLALDTVIYVGMKNSKSKTYSYLPLATAFSCTSQIFVPFDRDMSTAANMLDNLRTSFRWGKESEFDDSKEMFDVGFNLNCHLFRLILPAGLG
eukprot:gene1813-3514_t